MTVLLDNLQFIISQLRWEDLLDIGLVWIVVYRVLVLVRRSGAVQMLSGLGILAIAFISSQWLQLFTFNWLLGQFFNNLFLIVVVLFQGEIRLALAHFGSASLFGVSSNAEETHIIEEIAKASFQLAQHGHGGLIAMEKEISLDYHIEPGVPLHAKISAEIIQSIFHPSSPLHDGAAVIRQGVLELAGCFLPLSKNPVLDKNLGTRHRAGLGLSEETDALIIIVSEENNSVNLAKNGHLFMNLDNNDLRQMIYEFFDLKYKPGQSS